MTFLIKTLFSFFTAHKAAPFAAGGLILLAAFAAVGIGSCAKQRAEHRKALIQNAKENRVFREEAKQKAEGLAAFKKEIGSSEIIDDTPSATDMHEALPPVPEEKKEELRNLLFDEFKRGF